MLKIIMDSKEIANEEMINGVNIQKTSFDKIYGDINSLNRFQKYVSKSLLEGDKVIIVTFVDSLYKQNEVLTLNQNLKVINTNLTEKSSELIIKEIIKYKDKSLNYIEDKVNLLEEMFELLFISLAGY